MAIDHHPDIANTRCFLFSQQEGGALSMTEMKKSLSFDQVAAARGGNTQHRPHPHLHPQQQQQQQQQTPPCKATPTHTRHTHCHSHSHSHSHSHTHKHQPPPPRRRRGSSSIVLGQGQFPPGHLLRNCQFFYILWKHFSAYIIYVRTLRNMYNEIFKTSSQFFSHFDRNMNF